MLFFIGQGRPEVVARQRSAAYNNQRAAAVKSANCTRSSEVHALFVLRTLGDLSFQRASWSEHEQWFWRPGKTNKRPSALNCCCCCCRPTHVARMQRFGRSTRAESYSKGVTLAPVNPVRMQKFGSSTRTDSYSKGVAIHLQPPVNPLGVAMADVRTKILEFRGFDSNIILCLRGVFLVSIGNLPKFRANKS